MTEICICTQKLKNEADARRYIDALPFGEAEKKRLSAMGSTERMYESLGALLCLERLLKKRGAVPRKILRTPEGKPYFEGDASAFFSLSHSCGAYAAALGNAPLGLDVECCGRRLDTAALSRRFFTPSELCAYERGGATDESFLCIWTAKEAAAKLEGHGLAAMLRRDIPKDINIHTEIYTAGGTKLAVSIAERQKSQIIITEEAI